MDTLLHRYNGKIKGVLEGFDRIIFKGILRPICYAAGMLSRDTLISAQTTQ